MKNPIFLLIVPLITTLALASYVPYTYIADSVTNVPASVNSSHELETFIGPDSNVCKESGGNLAEILAALQSSLTVSGSVTVTNFPSSGPITGTVAVSNFPSPVATQTVAGSVSVSNFPSPVATQPVSGAVSVSNFPAPIPTQTVAGSVVVSNFPAPVATQLVSVVNTPIPVTGSFTTTPSGVQTVIVASPIPSQSVSVISMPAISVTSLPAINIGTSPVPVVGNVTITPSGVQTVNVNNFPATQTVVVASPIPSQTVSVSNFPSVQTVNVDNFPAPSPTITTLVSNPSVSVTNTPAVSVNNFPATQTVSGTVNIGTFPSPLSVIVTGGSMDTVSQGSPGPAASAWPVYLPSPIPSQTVSVSNFPAPVATQTVSVANTPTVSVNNFPTPSPTITVTGNVVATITSPIPSQTVTVSNPSVSVTNTPTVSVNNFPATQVVSGTVNIGTFPSPLPVVVTGGSMDTVSQGSPGPAASAWPVYLPSPIPSQTVSVSNFPSTQTVTGTVNIGTFPSPLPVSESGVWTNTVTQATASNLNATVVGSGNFTVVQPTGTNLHSVIDSGSVSANITNASIPVTQSGTWSDTVTQSSGANLHADIDNFPSNQTVTVSNPSVSVTNTPTVNQGAPGPIASPWAVFMPSPIPSQTVTVANPSVSVTNTPVVNQGSPGPSSSPWPVVVENFPTPSPTIVISGTVNQGTPGPSSSPWPVLVTSPIPSQTVTVANFPSTQTVNGTVNIGTFPSPLPVTQSGTWSDTVTQSTAANLNATVVGSGNFTVVQPTGTNLHAVIDSGSLNANVTNASIPVTESGTWTNTVTQSSGANLHADIDNFPATQAVTQSTSPWVVSGTVTSNIGTTGGLQLDTTGAKLNNAQASTTSGETGPLIQGAVTTSAPTYTTATTNPLSMTTSGALRTDASATTQPVSGTVTANAGTGTFQTNVTNASIPVTESGTWTNTVTQATASNLNATVVGSGNFTVVQPTGTNLHEVVDSGSITANAGTNLNTSALALESGGNLASIKANQTNGTQTTIATQATGSNLHTVVDSGSITANIGTIGGIASSSNQTNGTQQTEINNGSTIVAVKAASTAAIATDPALVVAVSPNNTPVLPSGAARDSSLSTINTTLGSPFQSGGSIGNTSFGISGTLPAYASTPTFNLGTISTAATASNQTSQITQETTTATNTGTIVSNQTNGTQITKVSTLPSDISVSGSVTAQDTVTTSTTGYNNQVFYSGTPTAGSFVSTGSISADTAMITVSGTWTGTLQFEISTNDGTTWLAHSVHQVGSSSFITSVTANFAGSLSAAAKTMVRVRATAAMTGSASVLITTSNNPSNVYVANSVKLLDGSSSTSTTTMNIVPASTAVGSTNTAISVGLNPNSPLPAGANFLGSLFSWLKDGAGNVINSISSTLDVNTQTNHTGTPTETSVSCGTSSTALLAAGAATSFIMIRNPTSVAVTDWINITGAAATTASPSIDLPPGGEIDFTASENSYLPTSAFTCISGGASASPLIEVYK